jgi:hypothetical protein
MINISKLGVVGTLLLLLLPSIAQEGPMVVKLTVKHDGQEKPAPGHVTLSFDKHSVQVPVRDGKFEVPSEAAGAHRVTFVADVGDDHIQISKLSGKVLAMENWTLLLAERRYDDDHQWAVPKGTNIPASCMLVFDSVHADPGTVVFDPHCRSRRE